MSILQFGVMIAAVGVVLLYVHLFTLVTAAFLRRVLQFIIMGILERISGGQAYAPADEGKAGDKAEVRVVDVSQPAKPRTVEVSAASTGKVERIAATAQNVARPQVREDREKDGRKRGKGGRRSRNERRQAQASERARDQRTLTAEQKRLQEQKRVGGLATMLLNAAKATLSLDAGFFKVGYSLHTSFSDDPPAALIHLNITELVCSPRVSPREITDRLAQLRAFAGSMPSGRRTSVLVSVPVETDIRRATSEEIDKRRKLLDSRGISRNEQWADFVKGPGTDMVLVGKPEGGRKLLEKLTSERAPLRAQRLRLLQSLLSVLPDIVKEDPELQADEKRRIATLAVATAVSVRGAEAVYKTRSKIYSARRTALSDEQTFLIAGDPSTRSEGLVEGSKEQRAESVQKSLAAYDAVITSFDRALSNTESALIAGLDQDGVSNATHIFNLLVEHGFNVDRMHNHVSPEERVLAEKILASLRGQLREYADSVNGGVEISRGANKIKTILGYVGVQSLSKKLLESCRAAAEKGGVYTPDVILSADDVVGEARVVPSDAVLGELETLTQGLEIIRTEVHKLDGDVMALRSAFRLGEWDIDTKWQSREGEDFNTLGAVFDVLPQRLSAAAADISKWIVDNNIIERAQDTGANGAAFNSILLVARGFLSTLEDLEDDMVALKESTKDERIMRDVKLLSGISRTLRSDMFDTHPGRSGVEELSPEEGERLALVEDLLFQIDYAISNEEWLHVRRLAETLPSALGLNETNV